MLRYSLAVALLFLKCAYGQVVDCIDPPPCARIRPVCSGSAVARESNPFLRYLRSRKKGLEPTSATVAVNAKDNDYAKTGISGAVAVLKGPVGEHRAKTKEKGRAIIGGIRAGEYTMGASGPGFEEDSSRGHAKKVIVLDRACASGEVILRSKASVAGLLREHNGRNGSGVEVNLVRVEPGPSPKGLFFGSFQAVTDRAGWFYFDSVIPGRYLLGTNLGRDFAPTSFAPPTEYPGRLHKQEATGIVVGDGERSIFAWWMRLAGHRPVPIW